MWNKGLDKLMEFKTMINEINTEIQFTMEYSDKQLPFLDILVIKKNSKIETDIFYKPTDSKQYLLFSSCHPKHTRINVPYNLAKRICTIIPNTELRDRRLFELKTSLLERGYPVQIIENGITKAKSFN